MIDSRVPYQLRTARIVMFIQGVWGIVGNLFILFLLSTSNPGDGAGLIAVLSVVSIVVAVVIFICAVLLTRRVEGVRVTTLCLESFLVLAGLVGLLTTMGTGASSPGVVAQLILCAMVITSLLHTDVRKWFATPDIGLQNRPDTDAEDERHQ